MIDAATSRLLNALALIAISAILLAAFYTQIVARELPCPLCILQRAGFVAVGLGLALNLLIGPRPGHYGLMILAALAGGAVSLRQVALHIVPGSGAYGDPVLGLHLYSWAALIFGAIILGAAAMLFFERQFEPTTGARAQPGDPRRAHRLRSGDTRQCRLDPARMRHRPLPGQPRRL